GRTPRRSALAVGRRHADVRADGWGRHLGDDLRSRVADEGDCDHACRDVARALAPTALDVASRSLRARLARRGPLDGYSRRSPRALRWTSRLVGSLPARRNATGIRARDLDVAARIRP